jgi:hypothetical protein
MMDSEIEAIRQELSLLRARYALYGKAARVMRGLCMVLIPVVAITVAVLAVEIFMHDVLYGAFFLAVVLLCVAAMTWFIGSLGLRWIDFVSQSPRGIYNPYFFHPDIDPRLRARSDAALIEQQIVDRERRLSELEVSGSENHTIH